MEITKILRRTYAVQLRIGTKIRKKIIREKIRQMT